MNAIGVDAWCATCGEDVENPIDGRCPKCSRTVIGRVSTPPTTNHRKPTLAEALAALMIDIQHEIEEQQKARARAGDAVTLGRAVLLHLQRAADVAAGKKRARVASCTECGKAIAGTGSTGLCQSCATKAYRARRSA